MNINGMNHISMNNTIRKEKTDQSQNQEKLLQACKDFEAIFTGMMFKEMNKTVMESGDKSRAREIYTDMFNEKLAEEVSEGENNIGIAKMLYQQMKNRV